VAENLIAAADQLLRTLSYFDLSEKRIAEAAGVAVAMIRYYFGGRDGLLLELLRREIKASLLRLREFDTMEVRDGRVTRRIFGILADLYYGKPWLMRLMIVETTRERSPLRSSFIAHFGTNVYGEPLQRLIERLKRDGIYRPGIDAEMTALSMRAMMTAPLMLAPLSEDSSSMQRFHADSWLDHLAHLFDAELVAPRAAR
jgi:AcrR family transcriptional regulator